MHIEIIHQHTQLSRERLVFYCRINHSGIQFVLDEFYSEHRESPRHKYKTIKKYSRLDSRGCNLQRNDIVIPNEIKEEVIQKLINSTKFVYELT